MGFRDLNGVLEMSTVIYNKKARLAKLLGRVFHEYEFNGKHYVIRGPSIYCGPGVPFGVTTAKELLPDSLSKPMQLDSFLFTKKAKKTGKKVLVYEDYYEYVLEALKKGK